MRAAVLLFLVAGCEAGRPGADLSGNQLGDGFLASEDLSTSPGQDLSRGVDLAGVDLRGLDLSTAPADMTSPGDMAIKADGSMSGVATPDTCGGAVTLVSGIELVDQDNTGLADDYHIGALSNGTCNKNDNVYKAPDAAYTISVPSGATLKVRVQPFNLPTRWDPAIAIVTDCANGASCLAGHDETDLMGNPEEVSWTNPAGSAQTVFILVDSYFNTMDNQGRFSILAVIQ